MEHNQSLQPSVASTPSSSVQALEWSICPGAAENAYTSILPHGCIITASSFTSLYLLHAELCNWERVQYEVHLLTAGLLQIGWCVTACGLPFTTNEGVGDFPLSVAADGCRGILWNLTRESVPTLRWKPGDILSCYANFSTGTFDFSLNGVHCCSATLPTKSTLLREGAKWYTDQYSTDEMLVYAPALSLAAGEACLVNLGEAPFRYPRSAYSSIDAHHTCGGLDYGPMDTPLVSNSSGVAGGGLGTGSPLFCDSTQPSAQPSFAARSASKSSAASSWTVRAVLGGTDLENLFILLDIRAHAEDVTVGPMELLARCITSPHHRVSDTVLTLVDWFQVDTQTRWRAFCMVLYLWVLRCYWYAAPAAAAAGNASPQPQPQSSSRAQPPAVGAEPIPKSVTTLSEESRRRMHELIIAVKLFLPASHFAVVPGVLVTIIQHRMGNQPTAQAMAARMVCDLNAIEPFRRAWVRDTPTFCSTLLNLCAIQAPTEEETQLMAELIARSGSAAGPPGAATPAGTVPSRSNRQSVDLLLSAKELAAQRGGQWHSACQCVEEIVADDDCRGPLVMALLRFMGDLRLRQPVRFDQPLRTPSYNDALPYTFSLYMQPMVVGLLVLLVTSSLGKILRPLDQSCPVGNADPLGGLMWRDVAVSLLPVSTFYFRNLTGHDFMPSDWLDVRGSGSFHYVKRLVNEEEAATEAEHRASLAAVTAQDPHNSHAPREQQQLQEKQSDAQHQRGKRVAAKTGTGAGVEEGESLESDDDNDASTPPTVTRRTMIRPGRVQHTPEVSPPRQISLLPDLMDVSLNSDTTTGIGEGPAITSVFESDEEVEASEPDSEALMECVGTASSSHVLSEHRDDTVCSKTKDDGKEEEEEQQQQQQQQQQQHGGYQDAETAESGEEAAEDDSEARAAPENPEAADLESVWSTWMLESRYWAKFADETERRWDLYAAALHVGKPTPESGPLAKEALAAHGKELLLVTTLAASVFTRPVLASSLAFLDSFNDGIAAYQQARLAEGHDDEATANSPRGSTNPNTHQQRHPHPHSQQQRGASRSSSVQNTSLFAERAETATASTGTDPHLPQMTSADLLCGLTLSVIPVLTMMDPSTLQGLTTFGAAVGKTTSYYWSRMALHEQVRALHGTLTPASLAELWKIEAAEALVAPPRAYLMLPLPFIESIVDLWLFSGVAHHRGTALTDRYPGLLLTIFDTMRRRAVSHSPTRSYMYRAMASMLGFGVESRLQMSRLMLEQERHCFSVAASAGSSGANGTNHAGVPVIPILQGSILDCLDVYLRDDNFNDASSLNFLFALAQEETCLLPPPRMMDEGFWWCLPSKITGDRTVRCSSNNGNSGTDEEQQRSQTQQPTADEAYLQIFCRATADVDLQLYSVTVISKCNRLLTQFSQLLPVRSPETMTGSEVRSFRAKYCLLRKSLYVLDFILRALDRNEFEREGAITGTSPSSPPASCTLSRQQQQKSEKKNTPSGGCGGKEGVAVETFLRSSRTEAARSALMDVLVQILLRISFLGGSCAPSAVSHLNASRASRASESGGRGGVGSTAADEHSHHNTFTRRFSSPTSSCATAFSPLTSSSLRSVKLPPKTSFILMGSPLAAGRATGMASLSDVHANATPHGHTSNKTATMTSASGVPPPPFFSENVLLPAQVRDGNGRYSCASSPCTVVGLLAPVFAMLHRLLSRYGCTSVWENPYLAVSSDLEVLLARSQELLHHPVWWAEPPPLSQQQRGGEVNLDDADEFVPSATQATLAKLQEQLRQLDVAVCTEPSAYRRERAAHHHEHHRPQPQIGAVQVDADELLSRGRSLQRAAAMAHSTDADMKRQPNTVLGVDEEEDAAAKSLVRIAPATLSAKTAINRRLLTVPDDFSDNSDDYNHAFDDTPARRHREEHIPAASHQRTRTAEGIGSPLSPLGSVPLVSSSTATTSTMATTPAAMAEPSRVSFLLPTTAAVRKMSVMEGMDSEQERTQEAEEKATEKDANDKEVEEDAEEDADKICQICLERPTDLTLQPCGHGCCHLCFSRSRATMEVVMRVPHAESTPTFTGSPISSPRAATAARGSAGDCGFERSLPSMMGVTSSSSIFTVSVASLPCVPPATELPRCFFCKSVIERLVAWPEEHEGIA